MKNKSLISLIITTRNSEVFLTDCLKSVASQTYPQSSIEIIVVDNNSTDRTREIAHTFTSMVYKYGSERSEQRNYGIEKSHGKYILYLDSDMILSPNVIKESVEYLNRNPDCYGLYIPEIIKGNGFWCDVRKFERSFYNATVIDAVRIVRKSCIHAIGMFDTLMTGPEDWDFDKRVRNSGKTALISSPIFHNESHFQFFTYIRKKIYYAGSFETYIKKWGKNDPDIQKQFGFWYRYIGVFIENGKWEKLIKHPILTIGMYTLRLCVGITYICVSKK
ncbi:MAG: glycosyltransferase [Candidatus Roizmanbacteria bacterium]